MPGYLPLFDLKLALRQRGHASRVGECPLSG
jgi:hypothetical protein